MGYMNKRYPHEIECTIAHRAPKSWIIEMSDGSGRYILPFKCVEGETDAIIDGPDEHGNYVFRVNDWWYNKIQDGEFSAS